MPPRPRARVLAVGDDGRSVHDNVVDALHVGERLLERRAVGKPLEVEHDEVGRQPCPQLTSIEPEVARRHARHLPNRLFQRQRADFADVMGEVMHVAGVTDWMAGTASSRASSSVLV